MLARIVLGVLIGLAVGFVWRVLAPPVGVDRLAVEQVPVHEARTEESALAAGDDTRTIDRREEVLRSAEIASQVFDPERGVVVFGTVADAEGRPVSSGMLVFEQSDDRRCNAALQGGLHYAVSGLRPGPVLVRGYLTGCAEFEAEFEVPETASHEWNIVVTRTRRLPVLFTMRDGTLWPFGERDGTIAGFAVLAGSGPWPTSLDGLHSARAQMFEQSWFVPDVDFANRGIVFERPCHGVLELAAPAPLTVALLFRGAVLQTRPLGVDEFELVFVVDQADVDALRSKVRVRVIDGVDGTEIVDGVELTWRVSGSPAAARVEDGCVCFDDVLPGAYELYANSPSSDTSIVEIVEVGPAANIDLGTRVIEPPVAFEVHVFDANGAPFDTAVDVLHLSEQQGFRFDLRTSAEPIDGRPGVARVRRLPAGPVLVRTKDRSGVALVAVHAHASDGAVVVLNVPAAEPVRIEPAGRVRDDANFALEDAAGLELWTFSTLPRSLRLPPGRYTLVRRVGEQSGERADFEVAPGATRVVVGESP